MRPWSSPRVKTEPVHDTSGYPPVDPRSGPWGTPDGHQGVTRPATARRRLLLVCCLIAGTGLLLVVAGSFLPWVVSGTVSRSSYAIVGIADRLGLADDGPLALLVVGWPFVGALCVAPVVAGILRWWRTAGVLCVLYGLVTGLLSFGLLAFGAGRAGLGIRLEPTGPAVMAAGAVLLVCSGTALALGAGSPVRHRNTRLPATQAS
jgi:hypothetical protein